MNFNEIYYRKTTVEVVIIFDSIWTNNKIFSLKMSNVKMVVSYPRSSYKYDVNIAFFIQKSFCTLNDSNKATGKLNK